MLGIVVHHRQVLHLICHKHLDILRISLVQHVQAMHLFSYHCLDIRRVSLLSKELKGRSCARWIQHLEGLSIYWLFFDISQYRLCIANVSWHSIALLVKLVTSWAFDALLVSLVVCHHSNLFLHNQNALWAHFHSLSLVARFFWDCDENFLERIVFIFLCCHICLELFVVFINLWLAIFLHTFNFLNEVLHQDVDFSPETFCFPFEIR